MRWLRAPQTGPTFVVTFGLHGSGSTWIFNVVRQLLDEARLSFNSSDGELLEFQGLLHKPLKKAPFTILKAHSLSLPLLRVMEIAFTKVIVSTRDPRDSALSHMERFDFTLNETVNAMSRAMATGKALEPHVPQLVYRYEDRFMDDPATILEIARFLNVPVTKDAVKRIHNSLRSDSVKKFIEDESSTKRNWTLDPTTRWNAKHIGDGRSGKWKDRLPPDYAEAVTGALSILEGDEWKRQPIRWSADLFLYGTSVFQPETLPRPHSFRRTHAEIDIAPGPTKRIELDGDERFPVIGPYLYVPMGRWRAVIDLKVTSEISGALYADIFLPAKRESPAKVRITKTGPDSKPIELVFDHHDHFDSIELRILADEGSFGTFDYSGARLYWEGPL